MKKNILILGLCLFTCFRSPTYASNSKIILYDVDNKENKKYIKMETFISERDTSNHHRITQEQDDGVLDNLKLLTEALKTKKVARLASFDGGGIRGMLFAVLLADLEKKTNMSIAELFHMYIGTSTGGFAAAGLNIPDPNNHKKPKFSASQLLDLYLKRGPEIFTKLSMPKRIMCMFRDKYSASCLEKILQEYFGDVTMAELLNEVIITYCNLTANGKSEFIKSSFAKQDPYWKNYIASQKKSTNLVIDVPDESLNDEEDNAEIYDDFGSISNSVLPEVFSSNKLSISGTLGKITSSGANTISLGKTALDAGQKIIDMGQNILGTTPLSPFGTSSLKSRNNFFVRHALRATSAAPTFFPPYQLRTFQQVTTNSDEHIDVLDGGLSVNKPYLYGLTEMFNVYPNADAYMVVSFGTGESENVSVKVAPKTLLGFASMLPDIFMGDEEKMNHHLLKIFGQTITKKDIYLVTLQVPLSQVHMGMDDVSPANLQYLYDRANEIAEKSIIMQTLGEILPLPLADRSLLVRQDDQVPHTGAKFIEEKF
ncbi:MAG: patatin-like phospholipase family protein [Holosporaceae bacterium]|jgi:patatin-like phospholipase/acyl hydrolase|nr:patatin-like phospholipase family protein [Holosporaceae bacterium]